MKGKTPRQRVRLARQRMSRRRDRFVVGYLNAKNTIYGERREIVTEVGCDWTDPLTLAGARQRMDQMNNSGAVIFELVPVITD